MKLSLVNELNESRQFRTKQAFGRFDARVICDMAFLDMCSLWILYNEFETSPWAIEYAAKTSTWRGFSQYRQMATDTYHALHVIDAQRTDLLGSEADQALLGKAHFNDRQLIQNLILISRNKGSDSLNRQTLQRLEQSLHIQESNYRSIRRLVQNWKNLTTGQKRTVMTRLNFFYMAHAKRSEIAVQIHELAYRKNLLDRTAEDPEKFKKLATVAAAGVAGYALGTAIGNRLV